MKQKRSEQKLQHKNETLIGIDKVLNIVFNRHQGYFSDVVLIDINFKMLLKNVYLICFINN